MNELLYEIQEKTGVITLNRGSKNNAFDDKLLPALQSVLDEAIANPEVLVIVLKANGRHFSAGADIAWMQGMVELSEAENLQDALVLAQLMHTLHHCPKPTIAAVQGAAFGGGAGLVAACDIAIAAHSACFCFSEVTLGLVPAVISPYVVKAMGERTAKCLFLSAEKFDAAQARQYNLVHHCVDEDKLESFALDYARRISRLPKEAVAGCKTLVDLVANTPITKELIHETASIIAIKRVSEEGQRGLRAFLESSQKPG